MNPLYDRSCHMIDTETLYIYIYIYIYIGMLTIPEHTWGRRGRDRMVVGSTTTYATSDYQN